MAARLELAGRAATLAAAGTPFVWATVVRARRPTSAKPGDSALVLADGQVDGFVGGDCAESTVRTQALEVLATGKPRVVRITPSPEEADAGDDVVTVYNPCLSGGTLEIFLEPAVPCRSSPCSVMPHRHGIAARASPLRPASPADREAGRSAAARGPCCRGRLARQRRAAGPRGCSASGRSLRRIGRQSAPGSSRSRSLEVDERMRSRVRTPAGIDIGARTAPEVAFRFSPRLSPCCTNLRRIATTARTGARQYRAGARSGVRHDGCPGRGDAARRNANRDDLLLRHRLSKRLPRQPSGVRAVIPDNSERRATPAGSRQPSSCARHCRLPR